MGVRMSHLLADRRTVAVAVGEEQVAVTYRPRAITPETEDRLRELVEQQRAGASLVELLAPTLVEWDLLDDDGKALPTAAAELRRVPIGFLAQVVQAITDDLRPKAASSETSAAG